MVSDRITDDDFDKLLNEIVERTERMEKKLKEILSTMKVRSE
jgi:hypothetical protein